MSENKEDTPINKEHQINHEIKDREVRVVDEDGTQLGIMSADEANRLADSKNLDLVKISPQAVPPVCKLLNYGKYRFELIKKEKETKKEVVQGLTPASSSWSLTTKGRRTIISTPIQAFCWRAMMQAQCSRKMN